MSILGRVRVLCGRGSAEVIFSEACETKTCMLSLGSVSVVCW